MAATILNSGTPLTGGPAAPPWTALCDTSANLVNELNPPDLVIPINGASGPGTIDIPFWVKALGEIEAVIVTGTMKGKRGDTLGVSLIHEAYGTAALLQNHGILGDLTTPYPLPGEERTFTVGEAIPAGYTFQAFAGASTAQQIVLPDGQAPTDNYYYYTGQTGFDWQIKSQTPGGVAATITVPAHRYPYSPIYNWNNMPYSGFLNQTVPIVFRGFRYRMLTPKGGEPKLVSTQTFTHTIVNSGVSYPAGYESTGDDEWNDFNGDTAEYEYGSAPNTSYSETLWTNYAAHFWQVTAVSRSSTTYTEGELVNALVVDTITVEFFAYEAIEWSVEPLTQFTWESVSPPSCVYQYYPPDYGDYLLLGEREEPLKLVFEDWMGYAADGVWKLQFSAVSAPIVAATTTYYSSTAYSPTVQPATVRIDNLQVTIKFKKNQPYETAGLDTTTPSEGVVQCYTQLNLRANAEDRAMGAILCGIGGSTTMGILCGYAVQRVGRTGEIYTVSYFLATTCNVNHVNLTRNKASITYAGQTWANPAFSTKGDAGEAYVIAPQGNLIYPVRGQIGLLVQIIGSQLTFQLMGQYPPLVFNDPTVLDVNTFTRVSLNA